MMNENIHIYKNTAELSEGFTSLLKEELDKKEIVNISLSGGTTPKALFKYWTANYAKTLAWEKIAFFWGDERCVPPEDPMSNYGMTKDLLLDLVEKIDRKKVHRIHGENEPEEEVDWYEDIMDKYLPKENDLPCFDLFMLGLGDDGHTVSIFPNQISLWNSPHNCIEAKHPETWMPRISMTGRIVNNARNIAFLVTGKNKAEKVKQIIKQREEFFDIYPAAKVNPTNGNLHWFIDEEAASLL
jgi:6-phosphogluconolactonase